jgi:signal transduction histidine kinase
MGDPNRIKQILMNFLSNAVKFTAQGHIEVNVHISPLFKKKKSPSGSGAGFGWQDIDEIRIDVKDTGIGISDTSKLFAPFVQAALSTSRMYGGTGLGLSICRQLADIMGGQVSTTFLLSSFIFFCPLNPPVSRLVWSQLQELVPRSGSSFNWKNTKTK